jgi:hypothetical protein
MQRPDLVRAAALAAALGLAACAPAAPPEGAEARTFLTATATVLAVDPEARVLRLRDARDGREFTVQAEADAGDLRPIRPGDAIMVDYYASTALDIARPGTPLDAAAVAGSAPTPVGEGPGGVAVQGESLVVDFLGFDPATRRVVVQGPDGARRSLVVDPPLDAFAASLTPGDRILVTVTEAVALSVTPGG